MTRLLLWLKSKRTLQSSSRNGDTMSFEFEYNGMLIEAEVSRVRDYYGTGDSPTMIDVEILDIIDEDGKKCMLEDFDFVTQDAIMDVAVSYAD